MLPFPCRFKSGLDFEPARAGDFFLPVVIAFLPLGGFAFFT
jgi:hypothetical protein